MDLGYVNERGNPYNPQLIKDMVKQLKEWFMKLRDVVLLLVTVFIFISCGSNHEEHAHDEHDHDDDGGR